MSSDKVVIEYNDKIVRQFCIATVIWAIVGMLAGVIVAFQLNFWEMNGKFVEWITFGAVKNEGIDFLTFGRLLGTMRAKRCEPDQNSVPAGQTL